jgi:hypothetical protein
MGVEIIDSLAHGKPVVEATFGPSRQVGKQEIFDTSAALRQKPIEAIASVSDCGFRHHVTIKRDDHSPPLQVNALPIRKRCRTTLRIVPAPTVDPLEADDAANTMLEA